ESVGAPGLRARAGVLTGEATVNLGATGEGMVAVDMVNTASRIQSAAEPGQVYVGETTRRVTEASIAYEDAGARELKGKAEPVQLWRALRVVAGVAGALKSEGLEAPFVGRDRELRVIKDLFHVSVEERRAHLVSVVGIGGIGKSRLGWEFYKYMDGLKELFRWHRGRCLAYGEGVAYWALAEMVRGRAEIVEGEDPDTSAAKLSAAVETYVLDPEERRWIEPRLAHLIGLEERRSRGRSSPSDARPGARGNATSRRSTSSRCRTMPWSSCWEASCRDCRRTSAMRSSNAPRAYRCTPSRRFGCSSTAGCSCRRTTATG